ncbi:TPA: endo-beta-N-acetylglucosaminidase [Streptococcus pneumoniae]|nr:endo-beta-N-acetylglucosaminidase [Streptococcus pneumoniae]
MNKKKLLVCAVALSTVGVVSTIDTAGVLPFSAQTVHAEITRTENHEVKSKITPGSENGSIYVDMTVENVPVHYHVYIYADIVNAKTGQIPRKDTFNERFDRSSVPITKQGWTNFANVLDGEYYLQFHGEDDYRSVLYKFIGKSATFTVKDQKYVNPLDSSTPKETEKPTATETSKPATNSSSGQTGWSGSSYYKAGVKVVNQWIFDVQYNSYFYLNASGNFVQNAWSGSYYLKSGGYMAKSEWIYDNNYQSYYYLTAEGSYARNAWSGSYYLKSDGKMAKSEWIYDSSYQSYYYLTSEGSYARNTWVGDYYLKSDGKMAVNERTPDGYKVDGSGKWVR